MSFRKSARSAPEGPYETQTSVVPVRGALALALPAPAQPFPFLPAPYQLRLPRSSRFSTAREFRLPAPYVKLCKDCPNPVFLRNFRRIIPFIEVERPI